MTNKTFYAAAFQEVQGGAIDNALWIKVHAEMPGADKTALQAKYIQLRAQEIAVGSAKNSALRTANGAAAWFSAHKKWWWRFLCVVGLYLALCVVVGIYLLVAG